MFLKQIFRVLVGVIKRLENTNCFLQIGGDKDVLPLPCVSKKKSYRKCNVLLLRYKNVFVEITGK